MFRQFFHLCVVIIDKSDHVSFPRLDLFDVGNDLVVIVVIRGDGKNRHILVDQGDRTVFHLCCRVTFRVDVRNLFQF